jgi:transposase
MRTYAGIDLHSTSCYLGILDDNDTRVFGGKLDNSLDLIARSLEPFKEELAGIAVESTFNWYWLVDGLQDRGYSVQLANPSAIRQYEGLKYTDDQWDAFWLAHMLRLGILPTGYIYPKEERPTRDLLRRRLLLVRQRTTQILSLQGMVTRHLGRRISVNRIKQLAEGEVEEWFDHPHLRLAAGSSVAVIQFLSGRIREMEKAILAEVRLRKEFESLLTVPGIGEILGLTIMLEVGDIGRFPSVQDYSSYCRCVKAERRSDRKKKGDGNRKNGNKYLGWSYVEAAHFAKRYHDGPRRFYQRKASQRKEVVAVKALANKLARASYYVMRDRIPYDESMLFR